MRVCVRVLIESEHRQARICIQTIFLDISETRRCRRMESHKPTLHCYLPLYRSHGDHTFANLIQTIFRVTGCGFILCFVG